MSSCPRPHALSRACRFRSARPASTALEGEWWIGTHLSRLASARTAQDDRDRRQQNPQVERERPLVDVLQIHSHPLVEVHRAPATRLPQSTQAGAHGEASTLHALDPARLVQRQRSRADEAHLALDHVEQLRQLVHAVAPDETAEPGSTGIVTDLENRAVHLVEMQQLASSRLGVGNHRAELVHLEGPTVKVTAHLTEDDRTACEDTRMSAAT